MVVKAPIEPAGVQRSRTWKATSYSGIALLVLVTVHMVAHHFVVEETGGLRTYAQILDYIANPVIFVIETLLLLVVTTHAMLGLRSVLFDFGLSAKSKRLVARGVLILGIVTAAYGVTLIGVLASRA
jgi:succinate dehydrogenase hydrophobic anchor subunit